MDWLAKHDVTSIAEAMVDGVDDAADEAHFNALMAEEGPNALPLTIYDFSRAKIETLNASIRQQFGTALTSELIELRTTAWESSWQPDFSTLTTEKFFVGSREHAHQAPPQKWPLIIEAKHSFGSGQHATTEAALTALELLAAPVGSGGSFLDLGTGSGILAIAAAKLGYDFIVATEIDSWVIAEARANGIRNHVEFKIENTEDVPDLARGYDVIAANILVPVLYKLLPQMAENLADKGHILLAGFIEKDERGLLTACERVGLRLHARLERRGWSCLTLVHARSSTAKGSPS